MNSQPFCRAAKKKAFLAPVWAGGVLTLWIFSAAHAETLKERYATDTCTKSSGEK